MEALILDKNFETIAMVDQFESFIWTDRYLGAGDFELYLPAETKLFDYLQLDNYLWTKNSDRIMIIESIQIDTDPEAGDHITVTGRSLESILYRRVIWSFTSLSGNLQNGIQKLLNENVISPSNSNRRIPNFTFKPSTDESITSLTLESTQYLGEVLYEVIEEICKAKGIGFKVTLDEKAKQFVFELYNGTDRSWEQNDRPWVVFSPSYDNLLATRYSEDKTDYHNAALTGGEGEGASKTTVEALIGDGGSGLTRYETFIEGSVSTNTDSEEEISPEEYSKMLKAQGVEKLAEYETTIMFDGELEARQQFVYRKDFEIGDIVQVANEYQKECRCRVAEIVMTHDNSGENMLPTFTNLDYNEDEV